jgi:hypothetical protein
VLSLTPRQRAASPYWAGELDNANEVLADLRSGHCRFADVLGGDALPAMISRWEEIALEIRDRLDFLAGLVNR